MRHVATAALASVVLGFSAHAAPANDPSADFPVLVGPPYAIGQTSFTPQDTMNYDAVGHAVVETDGEAGVAAAHHTLPVPSYVEVTALDTGHTILVRVDRRGPMDSDAVIALTAGAAAQLGIGDGAAVRVRRVNPPEVERAMLRSGGHAPARMDTPGPLLAVLKRRLQPAGAVPLNAATPGAGAGQRAAATAVATPTPPVTMPAAKIVAPKPATKLAKPKPLATAASDPDAVSPGAGFDSTFGVKPVAGPKPKAAKSSPIKAAMPARASAPAPRAAPAASASTEGGYVVQLGSFGEKANAEGLARKYGASARASGRMWRVRMGPYASREAADAALAKLRAAGYSGARLQRAD